MDESLDYGLFNSIQLVFICPWVDRKDEHTVADEISHRKGLPEADPREFVEWRKV